MRLWFYFHFRIISTFARIQVYELSGFPCLNFTWLDYLYAIKHNIFLSCRACCMLWTTKFYIRLITVMFYIQPQSKFLYCTMQRHTRNEISVMLKCQPLLQIQKYYYYSTTKHEYRPFWGSGNRSIYQRKYYTLSRFFTKFPCHEHCNLSSVTSSVQLHTWCSHHRFAGWGWSYTLLIYWQ